MSELSPLSLLELTPNISSLDFYRAAIEFYGKTDTETQRPIGLFDRELQNIVNEFSHTPDFSFTTLFADLKEQVKNLDAMQSTKVRSALIPVRHEGFGGRKNSESELIIFRFLSIPNETALQEFLTEGLRNEEDVLAQMIGW